MVFYHPYLKIYSNNLQHRFEFQLGMGGKGGVGVVEVRAGLAQL